MTHKLDDGMRPTEIMANVVILRRENLEVADRGVRIDDFVKLECGERMKIGKGVHVASFCHLGIGGGVTIIEDYVALSSGAKVLSGSNQPDEWSISATAPPWMQRIARTVTRLCRYSAVYTNAVVSPGVTLNEGAVLLPGAVATKDIPAWEIWGGVPARFVARREMDSDSSYVPVAE